MYAWVMHTLFVCLFAAKGADSKGQKKKGAERECVHTRLACTFTLYRVIDIDHHCVDKYGVNEMQIGIANPSSSGFLSLSV